MKSEEDKESSGKSLNNTPNFVGLRELRSEKRGRMRCL